MLDVWVRAYRAAAHAIMVVKGDKQEGTRAAARFDANTVVDILCELMGGRLVGVELKCLRTVKSTYAARACAAAIATMGTSMPSATPKKRCSAASKARADGVS